MTGEIAHRAICWPAVAVIAGMSVLPADMRGQSGAKNACDLNGDGVVDAADVKLAVDMSLHSKPCLANVIGDGVCNVVVVQRIVNAVGNNVCRLGDPHSVSLRWVASPSSDVAGYKVYRGTAPSGPYKVLNTSLVTGTSYTDTGVKSGLTYYYTVRAANRGGQESPGSNESKVVIPNP
jgi:hypothetical protein